MASVLLDRPPFSPPPSEENKKSYSSKSSSEIPFSFCDRITKMASYVATGVEKFSAFVLDPTAPAMINCVLGEARAVYGLVSTFFSNMIRISRFVSATEFSKVFSMPLDLYGITVGFYDLIVDKGEARVDAFLGILGNFSDVGDAISSLGIMLVEVGALGSSALSWAIPLNLASCVLSAVFIIMNVRSLYFSCNVLSKLNKKLQIGNKPDYKGACKVLKNHTYELERHCGVNLKAVQKKVSQIYKANRRNNTLEGNNELDARMNAVFKATKTRIYHKQFSLVLGILITKLGMLATLLFATSPFFHPLAIAGGVALAILFAACLFKMGFDFYANSRLKYSLKAIPTT